MRARHIALVASLLLSTACGATLVRGPTGWHEGERSYSIAPLDNGDLVPAGWTLKGYSQRKDGFRRDDSASYLALELDVRRMQDDGILGVQSYWLDEPDRAKRPDEDLQEPGGATPTQGSARRVRAPAPPINPIPRWR